MMYIGLPAPSCSRSLCPGCSQHTPTAKSTNGRNTGPDHLIPVTNAIEALNSKLRRAVRARGHFPSDEAALKLLFLVLNRSEKEWKMPPREWAMAKAQFAVLFGERFLKALAG
jgi:transposase-like protein